MVFVVYWYARDPVKVEETSSILAEHPSHLLVSRWPSGLGHQSRELGIYARTVTCLLV